MIMSICHRNGGPQRMRRHCLPATPIATVACYFAQYFSALPFSTCDDALSS